MGGDFHRKAFDEGTLTKLRLFRAYLREWLPVFTAKGAPHERVTVVDFFAGPGRDREGTDGSPLLAIREIRARAKDIRANGHPVRLVLNEVARGKYAALRAALEHERLPPDLCICEHRSLEFEEAFDAEYPSLTDGPNLLFLDQQGIKFITDEVFARILALPRTDFIFFIASSSLRRFAEHPYFKRHLDLPPGVISARRFNDTHRSVVEYYRSLVPDSMTFYLGRFSIKKGSNLYGLVFGSGHPRGMEKFLRVCWKEDPERGEANFDIDDEKLVPGAPHLFPDMDMPKKLLLFKEDVQRRVLSGELTTDRDVYVASLQEGFLPMHGRAALRDLEVGGLVRVHGGQRPRVSWDGYRQPRRLRLEQRQ